MPASASPSFCFMTPVAHPYRSLGAAVLILLYGLVCIPSLLWHDHPARATAEKNSYRRATEKKDSLQWSRHHVAGVCKICSHQQAFIASLHITNYEITTPVSYLRSATTLLNCMLPVSETCGYSNKGPPSRL